MEKIGPWEIIEERSNNNFSRSLMETARIIEKVQFEHLVQFWEFLHLYYVFNRAFKLPFFLDFKTNTQNKSVNIYIPLKPFFKPDFIQESIISKLPDVKKVIHENPKKCMEAVLVAEYNTFLLNEGINAHLCDLACSQQCIEREGVIGLLSSDYRKLGLFEIYSWEVSKETLGLFEAIFDVAEEEIHNFMERLYNMVLEKLIIDSVRLTDIKSYSNIIVKPLTTSITENLELDIVIESKVKKRILIIEVTSHSKKSPKEWFEHFKKKSAYSNILSNETHSNGWKYKYVYFYIHSFTFNDETGVFNQTDINLQYPFVPLQMWDFGQFKYMDKIWESDFSILQNNVCETLKDCKQNIIELVRNFLFNNFS
ncbi:hypothetical protein [Kosmotoga pacifica]|nr:hypothetical protein [Kosmotoga pacifica]